MNTPSFGNKTLILLVLSFNGMMVLLDTSIVNIAFPSLTEVFNTDPTVVLWISVAYSLVSGALMPVFGRLGDMYGRKKIVVIGLAIFTLGLVLCSVSQNIEQLILARIVQAVGGSTPLALGVAIITATFPDKERGRALGALTSAVTVGPLIAPAVGGLLIETLGWRAIFYIRVPLSLISVILTLIFLKEQRSTEARSKIDLWGMFTLISGLSCITLFFNLGGNWGFISVPVLSLAGATLIFFALFIIQERRFASPLINLTLFKNRIFTSGNITLFIQSFATSANWFLLPFLLINGLGYSTLKSGLLLMISTAVIFLSPISGWLSDRIGSKILCAAGMFSLCLALFLLSRLHTGSSIPYIALGLGILGLGNTLFMTPNTSRIMGASPQYNLGSASAFISTVRTVAMSTGTAIAGAIFTNRQAFHAAQLSLNNVDSGIIGQLSLISGYQDSVLVVAIICAIGIFTSLI